MQDDRNEEIGIHTLQPLFLFFSINLSNIDCWGFKNYFTQGSWV